MEEQAQQNTHQNDNQQINLDDVKKRALEALTDVMDDLENVDPERKFEMCLTAIRFTNNTQLTETALKCALAIEQKGTRAEALVNLINEVNYLQSK